MRRDSLPDIRSTYSSASAGQHALRKRRYALARRTRAGRFLRPLPHNRANNGTSDFLTAYAAIPNTLADSLVNTNSNVIGSPVLLTVVVTPGNGQHGDRGERGCLSDHRPPGHRCNCLMMAPRGGYGDAAARSTRGTTRFPRPKSGCDRSHVRRPTRRRRSASSTLDIAIANCTDSGAHGGDQPGVWRRERYNYVPNMDFAEIYNRSNAPVDMTGWNLPGTRMRATTSTTKIVAASAA